MAGEWRARRSLGELAATLVPGLRRKRRPAGRRPAFARSEHRRLLPGIEGFRPYVESTRASDRRKCSCSRGDVDRRREGDIVATARASQCRVAGDRNVPSSAARTACSRSSRHDARSIRAICYYPDSQSDAAVRDAMRASADIGRVIVQPELSATSDSRCRRSTNNAPSPTSSARWTTRSS